MCYMISTLVPRITNEPGSRRKDNPSIEACVAHLTLFCVSMSSRHKECSWDHCIFSYQWGWKRLKIVHRSLLIWTQNGILKWTVFGQLKSFRTFFFNPPTYLNPFGKRIVKTVQFFGQSLTSLIEKSNNLENQIYKTIKVP